MDTILPTTEPDRWHADLTALGYEVPELEQINQITQWADHSHAIQELDEWAEPTHPSSVYTLFTPLLNQVTHLNPYFSRAFQALKVGGYLVCRVEELNQRLRRIQHGIPPGLRLLHHGSDYLLHRLLPRLPVSRPLYQRLFPGHRALSKAEVLGRLFYAGFTVKSVLTTPDSLLIIAQKSRAEHLPLPPSSEGLLLRQWRVGAGGKAFCAYKFRTMHPYSEHVQAYLNQTNGLESTGKFKDDFRISTLGRWMRRYWIDELPMLINLLKGDIKLVGLRPISLHYLGLYPPVVQQKRICFKPGLLPPYYADLPKSFTDIVESELRYMTAYRQHPLATDLRYLLKIGYNILWKHARSN